MDNVGHRLRNETCFVQQPQCGFQDHIVKLKTKIETKKNRLDIAQLKVSNKEHKGHLRNTESSVGPRETRNHMSFSTSTGP